MSYGWLTESALLPKPTKKIKVESTSILSLQSLIQQGRQDKTKKPVKSQSNKNIELRIQKDMQSIPDSQKTQQILQKKTELYEKLAKGKLEVNSKDQVIDFNQKQIDNMDNYEDIKANFYRDAYNDLVVQEQEYLGVERNDFNKHGLDREIERIQWERDMIREIEDGGEKKAPSKGYIKQGYERVFTVEEKKGIQEVLTEEEQREKAQIQERESKEQEKDKRKMKLLSLL